MKSIKLPLELPSGSIWWKADMSQANEIPSRGVHFCSWTRVLQLAAMDRPYLGRLVGVELTENGLNFRYQQPGNEVDQEAPLEELS